MTNTERIKAEIAHQLHIWSVLYNGDEAKLKREPVVLEMRKLLAFIDTLPADTMYAVVDNYTFCDCGGHSCKIEGLYPTLDEAVKAIHALREREKKNNHGPIPTVEGGGEFTTWDFSAWDEIHHYEIMDAEIKSVLKTEKR